MKNNLAKKSLFLLPMTTIFAFSTIFFLSEIAKNNAEAASLESDPTIPEVHIDINGNAKINGLKVWQKAGSTFFARTTWDNSYIRWTVKTTAGTEFKKRYGDKMTASEIAEGDILSVEGYIEGGNSLAIIAKKVTDWSNYTALSSFSGKIFTIDSTNKNFILSGTNQNDITVYLTSTTTVIRNRREISPKYLAIGNQVTSINGTYNHQLRTLTANRIIVNIDPNIFKPKNYQGTLIRLTEQKLPTQAIVKVSDREYTVNLNTNAKIMNSARSLVTLDRFLGGDTVRFYGYIREDNDEIDTIEASIFRNISF